MNKFALFFPGQGSQSVGMMSGFDGNAVIQNTFAEASDILGVDFWKMATEDNELLNLTQHTQPLMLTAGVATYRLFVEKTGLQPNIYAGHSLGEYSALVSSGAISFAEALPLVKFRAEIMQSAVPEGVGAMAAVLGLEDVQVREVCAEAAQDEVCEAVNYNAVGQVVIAGNKAAVARGIALAEAKGAKKVVPLPVSVPSHCALMKPAADKLREYLQNVTVNVPNMPMIHNADVVAHTSPEAIKDALVRQLHSPVRWVETVQYIYSIGIVQAAECGPGKVLNGLMKRIQPEFASIALTSNEAVEEFKARLSV